MNRYFVITEEVAKKYGIQKREMDQIWQWYGEEELSSLLDYEFDKNNHPEKIQNEIYEEAIKLMDESMMSTVDSNVFDILDNNALRCLDNVFVKKWELKQESINHDKVIEYLEMMEKYYSIVLTDYKQSLNKNHEYSIVFYGNKNWTIEDVCMFEVVIDKDILNEIIKNKEEQCLEL